VKSATAGNWKNAASRFFSIVADGEPDAADVRRLDLDSLAKRLLNRPGNDIANSSMRVYRSRMSTALTEFQAYLADPLNYKPSIEQREPRRKSSGAASDLGAQKRTGAKVVDEPTPPSGDQFTVPIPLRDGVVTKIVDLPRDLSTAEAERISAIVKAFATGV
jgi:hypothetical protein